MKRIASIAAAVFSILGLLFAVVVLYLCIWVPDVDPRLAETGIITFLLAVAIGTITLISWDL